VALELEVREAQAYYAENALKIIHTYDLRPYLCDLPTSPLFTADYFQVSRHDDPTLHRVLNTHTLV
jgi:hypothetical protein